MTWYVSRKIISIDELDNTIPVSSLIVNKKINPIDHIRVGVRFIFDPLIFGDSSENVNS